MACVAPEGHQYDYMGCQTYSNGRPGFPCELCQYGSPTDDTAPPFVFEWLPTCLHHPPHPL